MEVMALEIITKRPIVFMLNWKLHINGKCKNVEMNRIYSMLSWIIRSKILLHKELATFWWTLYTLSVQVLSSLQTCTMIYTLEISTPPTPASLKYQKSSTISGTKVKCPSSTDRYTCASAESCILIGCSWCGLKIISLRRLKLMCRCLNCWLRSNGGVVLRNLYSNSLSTSMEAYS